MAFNLRDFEDEKRAKLGVVECVTHKLIDPYQVLYEKTGMICCYILILINAYFHLPNYTKIFLIRS